MSYKILNTQNLQTYLFSQESLKMFFDSKDVNIEEIGDGNLNFVFLITSCHDISKALILKQAVPYLRCVGEEYPLSKKRMLYEIRSLKIFAGLSEHIPKIYHNDEEMSLIVMEYLGEHTLMRKGMIEGIVYPNFAAHISSYLANTLFKTSSLYLSHTEKSRLIADFIGNDELCKLTQDFVFSAPFMEHDTNAPLPELHDIAQTIAKDEELKTKILKLKYKFMTQSDALLHGDLHTGSIMLNEKETYVFDSEFAFVGPFGFDIGALLANLVMSWISHAVQEKKEHYKEWILTTIITIWKQFESKFLVLWHETQESALLLDGFASEKMLESYKKEFMLRILQESIGFAGCKIMRRQLGIAGVEDIRGIKDAKTREKANRLALKIGQRYIKEHEKLTTIEDIINIIKVEDARKI